MTDHDLPPTATEAESETLDLHDQRRTFIAGEIVGERYQILALLGRGGMGEVWHAFDLKLRVDVALKALRSDIFKSDKRRESLRQEVRAAREVVSPNVCRVFDLHEMEGLELVSMEFVDGQTLLDVLRDRGPLDLEEAQDVASQFLAGLDAIHQIGLVHRDIKPENIMLTRAGRVVVMDFGIAREEAEGSGTVSGTAAYMAPEQAAGQAVDARADIYSAGVVLAEMINPTGLRDRESRESIWEAVRAEPAKIPDTPWAQVITKAVARDRDQRFDSANDLTRALEDVTLRVVGADDLHPYPGLASFTEKDAEYFFGREAEVEQVWRKLEGPSRMLAVVGPSGAGKTSFLQAGLFPTATARWATAICKPGNNPQLGLGRALAPEMAGDTNAMDLLLRFDDPDVAVEVLSRWRSRSDHALLVVDQFEELFTQNSPEVQQRFANLLNRLVLDADVCVLLSMRDDFMIRCRDFEALQPTFTDMTALPTLAGHALRRALVQPATKCGYRFENDELVDEMLAEVEGERGALPLLAFAASRLWEKRDRETGLLTRQAYQDIGGVGGALARHAESTIDRIGTDRIAIVREIFRNLVTAEGTRAVREWNELISIFSDSQNESPEEVLRQLIDARLLTSYEMQAEDEAPTRSVEIIHESLLANWPRLVRWQTQDADAVQLREQLRQAAKTWNDQGRSDDTLWTGAAFREFASWRERYPGGLTEVEETFAEGMTSFASRRRRRRRAMVAAGVATLVIVLAIITGLWRQSVRQARLAESSKLITLGNARLGASRTDALAYAIAALDRADTDDARRLAVKALWAGPTATVLPSENEPLDAIFSPDGALLAVGFNNGVTSLYPKNGGAPLTLREFEGKGTAFYPGFSIDGSQLVSSARGAGGEILIWDTQTGQVEGRYQTAGLVEGAASAVYHSSAGFFDPIQEALLSVSFTKEIPPPISRSYQLTVLRLPLRGGETQSLGQWALPSAPFRMVFDPTRGLLATAVGLDLTLYRAQAKGSSNPQVIFKHPGPATLSLSGNSALAFDTSRERIALFDLDGGAFLIPLNGREKPLRLQLPAGDPKYAEFSPDGSMLSVATYPFGGILWDLEGPAGADPLALDESAHLDVAFSPDERWLATTRGAYPLAVWPLANQYSRLLSGHTGGVRTVAFSNDGSVLYSQGEYDGKALAWPLTGNGKEGPVVIHHRETTVGLGIAVDPRGRFLIFAGWDGTWRVPLDDGERVFIGENLRDPILDPSGRWLAMSSWPEPRSVVVFDLDENRRIELDYPGEGPTTSLYFDSTGGLLGTRSRVVSRWDPATKEYKTVFEDTKYGFPFSDGRILQRTDDSFWIVDPEDGSKTEFFLPGPNGWFWNCDPSGSYFAKGGNDGSLLVWSAADRIPHLLLGHEGRVFEPFVSPDGKWVATTGKDETLRLWPMPDLSKPSLHSLSYPDLLAKLKSLTNLRAVPNDQNYTGFKIEPDFNAYQGWSEVPEW